MKYQQLAAWMQAAKQKYPNFAANIDFVLDAFGATPAAVVGEMRVRIEKVILEMTKKSLMPEINGLSLAEIWENLDPTKNDYRELVDDLTQDSAQQYQFHVTREELLEMNATSDVFKDRHAFVIPLENDLWEVGDGGLEQTLSDFYFRTFRLNGLIRLGLNPTPGQIARQEPRHTYQEVKAQLKVILNTDRNDLVTQFIAAHSQGVGGFVPQILGRATKEVALHTMSEDTVLIKQPEVQNYKTFMKDGELYLTALFEKFPLALMRDSETIAYMPGPMEATYKLKGKGDKWGYELVSVDSNNADIIRMVKGELIPSQELLDKYAPTLILDEELKKLAALEVTSETVGQFKENYIRNIQAGAALIEEEKGIITSKEYNARYKELAEFCKKQREYVIEHQAKDKITEALIEMKKLYHVVHAPAPKEAGLAKAASTVKGFFQAQPQDPNAAIYAPVIKKLDDAYRTLDKLMTVDGGGDDFVPLLFKVFDLVSQNTYKDIWSNEAMTQFFYGIANKEITNRNENTHAIFMFGNLLDAINNARPENIAARQAADAQMVEEARVDPVVVMPVATPVDEALAASVEPAPAPAPAPVAAEAAAPASPKAAKKPDKKKDDKGKEEVTAEDDAKRAAEEAKRAEDARRAAEEAKRADDARRAAEEAKHAEEIAFDSAKNKALNIMLRLQRLPAADQMNAITEDIDNFKRALDALNASIPGGFRNATGFADYLLSIMPPHVELYSAEALKKLEQISLLYGDRELIMTELWQAIHKTAMKLDGKESDESKYKLLIRKAPAALEIVREDQNFKNERKIIALAAECDEYMKHLGREIYEGIRDHDYELLKKNDEFQLLFRPDANSRIQFRIGHALSDETIRKRIYAIGARDEKYRLAVEKYEAVREMKNSLIDDTKNTDEKLQTFTQNFNTHKGDIEKSRDSAAMKFLKRVVTILTAGIAYAAGMWNIKGKQFSEKIDRELSDNKKPSKKKPK